MIRLIVDALFHILTTNQLTTEILDSGFSFNLVFFFAFSFKENRFREKPAASC